MHKICDNEEKGFLLGPRGERRQLLNSGPLFWGPEGSFMDQVGGSCCVETGEVSSDQRVMVLGQHYMIVS